MTGYHWCENCRAWCDQRSLTVPTGESRVYGTPRNPATVYECLDCGHINYIIEPSPEPEVKNVATVNFCERHSGFGKSSVMGALSYRTEETGQWHKLEICPDCVSDLVQWVKAGKELPPTHEPYLEPWKPEMPVREPSVNEQLIQRLDRLLANQESKQKALPNGDSTAEKE